MKITAETKSGQEYAADRAELEIISYLEKEILQGGCTVSDRFGRINGFDTDLFLVRQEDSGYIRLMFDRSEILAAGSLSLYDAASTSRVLTNTYGSDRMQSRMKALLLEHFQIDLIAQTANVGHLSIRPLLASDAEAAFQFLQAEKEAVWQTGFNSLPKDARDTLRWLHNSSLSQVAAFDEVGNIMGLCGVMPNFKGIKNEQSISLFYLVSPKYRGQGVASTLAVEAMKGHQDCHPAFNYVVIHAEESNADSLRVANHLGLRRNEETDYFATHFGKQVKFHGHSATIDDAIGSYLVKKMMREMPPSRLLAVGSANQISAQHSAKSRPSSLSI